MQGAHYGPKEIFSAPMSGINTRKVKTLRVIDACHFSTFTFQFPAASASPTPTDPTTVASYPPLYEFTDVKSFQIDAGTVEVIYYT